MMVKFSFALESLVAPYLTYTVGESGSRIENSFPQVSSHPPYKRTKWDYNVIIFNQNKDIEC